MHYEMSEDAARELVAELARQQAQETAQVEQVPDEEPGDATAQPEADNQNAAEIASACPNPRWEHLRAAR